jgi:hypothetical protein
MVDPYSTMDPLCKCLTGTRTDRTQAREHYMQAKTYRLTTDLRISL